MNFKCVNYKFSSANEIWLKIKATQAVNLLLLMKSMLIKNKTYYWFLKVEENILRLNQGCFCESKSKKSY